MEVFRFLGEALTKNWGLKLLSLALAIVIYHAMKPADARRSQDRNDRNIFQRP